VGGVAGAYAGTFHHRMVGGDVQQFRARHVRGAVTWSTRRKPIHVSAEDCYPVNAVYCVIPHLATPVYPSALQPRQGTQASAGANPD